MRNNSVIFFKLGPVVPEGMPLKDISYLELWQPLEQCVYYVTHHFLKNKNM